MGGFVIGVQGVNSDDWCVVWSAAKNLVKSPEESAFFI